MAHLLEIDIMASENESSEMIETVFSAPPSSGPSSLGSAGQLLTDKASELRDQASSKARDFAVQGKERTADALSSVARMVDDAATSVNEKVGEQYGAYVRTAAEAVSGLATTLRDKDLDELIDDAKEIVRKSPVIAIAAAAAAGFVVSRIIKSGSSTTVEEDATSAPVVGDVSPPPVA